MVENGDERPGESSARSAPIAFVLGTPRSGTTLLRVMLAGHPSLFSPPEMLLAIFETMHERSIHLKERFWEVGGLRRALMDIHGYDVDAAKAEIKGFESWSTRDVYALLQQEIEPRMLVDKCPHLCGSSRALARLSMWFPEARYLWIVRHPGAVYESIMRQPMSDFLIRSYASDAERLWRVGNSTIRRHLERVPSERWAMLRYEQLVRNPERVMKRACAALGVEFDECLLDPYEGDRMREGPPDARAVGDPSMAGHGRIRPELATRRLESFDPRTLSDKTRALALELGYDTDSLPTPPLAKMSDAIDSLWRAERELRLELEENDEASVLTGRRFLLRLVCAGLERCTKLKPPPRAHFPSVLTVGLEPELQPTTDEELNLSAREGLDADFFASRLERTERELRVLLRRTVEITRLLSMIAVDKFVEIPGERLMLSPAVRCHACCLPLAPGRAWFLRYIGRDDRRVTAALVNEWLESPSQGKHVILHKGGGAGQRSIERILRVGEYGSGPELRLDTRGLRKCFLLIQTTSPADSEIELSLRRTS